MFTQLQLRLRLPGVRLEDIPTRLPTLLGEFASVSRSRITPGSPWKPLDEPLWIGTLRALEIECSRGDSIKVTDHDGGDTRVTWTVRDVGALPEVSSLFTRVIEQVGGAAEAWTEFLDARSAFQFMPSPPLARDRLIYAGPVAKITAAYDCEASFRAGWHAVRELGAHRLCTRALDLEDVPAQLFPLSWTLARHVKVEGTEYPSTLRTRTPGERALVDAEPSRLDAARYDEMSATYVYRVALAPGQRLSARDILGIRNLLAFEEDERDRPVLGVRVEFDDRGAAERERRPLIDIGAEVWAHGERVA